MTEPKIASGKIATAVRRVRRHQDLGDREARQYVRQRVGLGMSVGGVIARTKPKSTRRSGNAGPLEPAAERPAGGGPAGRRAYSLVPEPSPDVKRRTPSSHGRTRPVQPVQPRGGGPVGRRGGGAPSGSNGVSGGGRIASHTVPAGSSRPPGGGPAGNRGTFGQTHAALNLRGRPGTVSAGHGRGSTAQAPARRGGGPVGHRGTAGGGGILEAKGASRPPSTAGTKKMLEQLPKRRAV